MRRHPSSLRVNGMPVSGNEKRGSKMKKQLARCLLLSEIVLMFGYANAYTWKDNKTGYTWTYRINGNGAEIYGEEYYDSLTGLNLNSSVGLFSDAAFAV